MLSVQDVGTQILGGNPGKFYVLCGTEYGIKKKYIDVLNSYYHGNQLESPTVQELINLMSRKHIVPLQPAVYVVRYDESFISSLSETTDAQISKLNIIGTIVCLYENSKHVSKLDKYLSNYTVSIDTVNPQFISKYLHSDFPQLEDRYINIAVSSSENYSRAKNMCKCMSFAPKEHLSAMSDGDIAKLFGCYDESTESQIRKGVASKHFNYLVSVSEKYQDNPDRILYTILQTMIELDKVSDNKHVQSDVKDYLKFWNREDIYYMFMHTYQELSKLRSMSSYDVQNSLIYLFGLLKFQRIPSLEVMEQ